MRGVNKVILIGNLGKDPELRYTSSGQAVANFPIATTEVSTNKEGNKQEYTEWHRIVAWGRLAEICGEYLTKGKPVYIEGSIRTRSWEDKNGNTRWTTEIVARNMQMLGSAGDSPSQSNYNNDNNENQPPSDFSLDDSSLDDSDEDIPF